MTHIALRNRPPLTHGIVAAAMLAVAGGALFAALTVWFTPYTAIRWITMLLGGSYALYLLASSPQRTGRIATVACWCIGATACAWFIDSLAPLLIAHAAMIWLIRTLYFHASIVAALADLGLNALALAAAVWAARSSASVPLAIWCLFLAQALFVVLPEARSASPAHDDRDDSEFERARRSAEAALRRLAAIDR